MRFYYFWEQDVVTYYNIKLLKQGQLYIDHLDIFFIIHKFFLLATSHIECFQNFFFLFVYIILGKVIIIIFKRKYIWRQPYTLCYSLIWKTFNILYMKLKQQHRLSEVPLFYNSIYTTYIYAYMYISTWPPPPTLFFSTASVHYVSMIFGVIISRVINQNEEVIFLLYQII